MKAETLIFDKVKSIIPDNSEKTVFFAAISNTSYEVFFYSFKDGKAVQCFTLAEQGVLDGDELDSVFEAIVKIIKESKDYNQDKLNIATITVDDAGMKMNIDYYEINDRLYRIKKDWMKGVI